MLAPPGNPTQDKTPARKTKHPVQHGLLGSVLAAASVSGHKPKPVPVRRSPVFGAIGDNAAPIIAARQTARQHVQQAQSRLPQRPLPAVPVINHPSRKQLAAAQSLIANALSQAKGPQARADLLSETRHDPRLSKFQRAQQHYLNENTRQWLSQNSPGVIRAAMANVAEAKPGHHTRVGIPGLGVLGSIDLTPASIAIANALPGLSGGDLGPRKLVHNALGDVKSLVEGLAIAPIAIGSAAASAVGGNTKPGSALVSGAVKSLTHSSPAALLTGHPALAVKRFGEHPVIEGLNFAGAAGVAGRGVGAAARTLGSTTRDTGVRGALARAGSTVRPPLALTGDAGGAIVQRTYSKDSIRKSGQVARDSAREPLLDAKGNVVTTVDRGRTVPVLQATDKEKARHNRRQANFEAARKQSQEPMARAQAAKQDRVRGIKGPTAKTLVSLVAEGTVRSAKTFEADLRTERARIGVQLTKHAQEGGVYSNKGQLVRAQQRFAVLDKALKSPHVMRQADQIASEGIRLGGENVAREQQLVSQGLIDATQATRRRLFPAAITHLDAKHHTIDEHAALEQAASPTEKAAVSGRDPALVANHERAKVAHSGAKIRLAAAKDQLAKLRDRQKNMAGRHKVQAAIDAAKGARLTPADAAAGRELVVRAAQREGAHKQLQGRVAEARAAVKTAEAKARRTREDIKANPLPARQAGLRTAQGKHLPDSAIEAKLAEAGRDPNTVMYIRHGENGPNVFHSRFDVASRPNLGTKATTGGLYERGSVTQGKNLLLQAGVRQRIQLVKAHAIDRAVQNNGIAKTGNGGYWTKAEADKIAENLHYDDSSHLPYVEMPSGERLVPVRALASKLDGETKRIIREQLQGPAGQESLGARLLDNRLLSAEDIHGLSKQDRNYVLMPYDYVRQLQKHMQPSNSSVERFFQMLNRPFRLAVLPQPRWLTGNFIEPMLVRLPMVGSGVNVFGLGVDVAAAVKTVRGMERSGDPAMVAAAGEIRAQQFGGLLASKQLSVRRTPLEALPEGAQRQYAKLVGRLPVVHQMADMVGIAGQVLTGPARLLFEGNRVMEGMFQRAGFGHQVRADLREFHGSWLATIRLADKSLHEIRRGLVDTPTQRRFAQEQAVLLGKYDGYGPAVRHVIQSVAPFLPWAMNSARFIFWTMPAHHTVATAALLATNQAIAKDWQVAHAGAPPGTLQSALIRKDGGLVDLSRYTPSGLTLPLVEGDLQGVTDQFAPQLSGAIEAVQGRDPFGRALKVKPTTANPTGKAGLGDKLGIAGYGLLESLLPYLSTARRLREKGGTSYSNSTLLSPKTKPASSHMSAVNRTFNPLRPTYLNGGPIQVVDKKAQRQSGQRPTEGDAIDRALSSLSAPATNAAEDAAIDKALSGLGG